MKIMAIVSYDGTEYCGWQVQNNGLSVQKVIEEAIEQLTGEKVTVTGSGRTDAGVHAEGQVIDFAVQKATIPPENYARALNTLLPRDVRVLQSRLVKDDFNARKSAKRKTYCYSFYVSKTEKPLKERYALRIDSDPDLTAIEKAIEVVVGEHDFACFNASGGGAKTTVRKIYDAKFVKNGDGYDFFVTGNGFLYNMVRTLAGTLLEIGFGKMDDKKLAEIIEKKDRSSCGRTLLAKGLRLVKVEYDV